MSSDVSSHVFMIPSSACKPEISNKFFNVITNLLDVPTSALKTSHYIRVGGAVISLMRTFEDK